MHILDIEQKTGLDRATIRFYEKENLIVPKRESNGYRVYSEDDLQLLLKIKLPRQLSIPLTKIKDLQQGSANFTTVLQEQDTMPYYCKCAMFAFVGSRPDCTYKDLVRLEEEIAAEFYGQFAINSENGTYTAKININDVQIAWCAELINIDSIYNGILYFHENGSSAYGLELDMRIDD